MFGIINLLILYYSGSLLLPGQTVCANNCTVDHLVYDHLVFNITNDEATVTNTTDRTSWVIQWDECSSTDIAEFGLTLDKRSYVTYLSKSTCEIYSLCNAILFSESGELKCLK